MPPTPPTQIGPYRIVGLLGKGGMGMVYEAVQEPIQRRVALKVLLPQHVQNKDVLNRFFNEARVVNLIEHPSIVQVSDYGQTPDGSAYLVMEYLRGEALSSRLERLRHAGERMRIVEALQFAAQIADALAAVHERSVVHRDLKPANIMLVRDSAVSGSERAKILDFGIAKLAPGYADGTSLDAVIGTPQYMSPEQCRGAGGVDEKTDVYALGVMLYEMLAGRTPFRAESVVEYMSQHLFETPPPLRDLAPTTPVEVTTLVHRLLSKDKAARPSMSELSNELVRLLSRLSGVTPAANLPREMDLAQPHETQPPASSTLGSSPGQTLRPAEKPRARALRIFTVAAAVCLLTAAAVFGFRPWLQPHAATPTAPASLSARTPLPASSAAVPPLALPPSPPARVSVSAPATELQKLPASETLEPSKPAPRLDPGIPPVPTLAEAPRSDRPGHRHVAKPPRTPKSTPAHLSTEHGRPLPEPPRPEKPDSATQRAGDYEP